ncbi:Asp/Glu/hydantoin racemase [Leucobacter exalbidus]|uniref:Asp/Glu/hydantoin racemase n=1 Tax=Leucobacter exalbidus TaxID=662960 RepID=A0A940T6B6_9MICO|nr:Asp/Glu/hydantoin racemase [Leucobacter exalbidus]
MVDKDALKTLAWVEATHGDPRLDKLWSFLRNEIEGLAQGRVNVDFVHVPFASGGIRSEANRLLNDTAVLFAAVAQADHADAVVIGCWGAPTEAVRSAMNSAENPTAVTSLPDASVRLIGSLAKRAVLVTVAPTLVPIFEEDLRRMGALGFHEGRPVRAYSPESTHQDVLAALEDPEILISRFDAEAQRAVDDGADAIVVGCGYLAPIFTQAGYTSVRGHPLVPVLDCGLIAFEHAVMLLKLQAAGIAPTQGGYASPQHGQQEALMRLVKAMGRGM